MTVKNLHLYDTGKDLFLAAADDFLLRTTDIIKEKKICNVVLAGGNTPKLFFDTLVCNENYKQKIAWDKIRFFFCDERYVSSDDLQNNYHMVQKYLFSKVPVPSENIYRIPTTELSSAVHAAKNYENTLRKLFPLPKFQWPDFDISYLGLGDNGHTASLMPGTDLVKKWIENPDLLTLVASLWVEPLKMYRITLTPSAINHSHHIVFLVQGEEKAVALKKVLEERNNPLQYPAILIKNAVWFVDQAAAKQLTPSEHASPLTLSVDIGGTGIKMMILDSHGKPKTNYLRELTPHPATHKKLLALIQKMIQRQPISFDRVSAGFPGVVEAGVVKTAMHLHSSWVGKNLQKDLELMTGKLARVANDADVQGEGDIVGIGVELVITLGTGVGSALFINGELVPNLQLGHHPFMNNKTYEDLLGKAAFETEGVEQWSEYLKRAITLWQNTFNYQYLYLGGGYAEKIAFPLPPNVKISSNIEGILGGIKLWEK